MVKFGWAGGKAKEEIKTTPPLILPGYQFKRVRFGSHASESNHSNSSIKFKQSYVKGFIILEDFRKT